MKSTTQTLIKEADKTGYDAATLEKVIYLIDLLERINQHSKLYGKFTLKGGTALNLFLFDLPRLSVDIDLNYIGAIDRETMLEERKEAEEIIVGICTRNGYQILRQPKEHAGGKILLRYDSALGGSGSLHIDFNYIHRVPLWEPIRKDSCKVGSYQAKNILVNDEYDLFGGKLAALFARDASRDLFDTCHMFDRNLDITKLRLAFVIYGAMDRHDWRKMSVDNISFNLQDIHSKLMVVMHEQRKNDFAKPQQWGEHLVEKCRTHLTKLLPFDERELGFLNALMEKGEITPNLLTDDPHLQKRILQMPCLLWKAKNVKAYKKIGV